MTGGARQPALGLDEAFRQISERATEMYGGHSITVEQERAAITWVRPYMLPVLRRRQDDRCWFCEGPLPETDEGVDLHHVIPLRVAFPDGHGRPSTAADLRVVHRTCHKRKPRGVR